jgi:O-antigen ligase
MQALPVPVTRRNRVPLAAFITLLLAAFAYALRDGSAFGITALLLTLLLPAAAYVAVTRPLLFPYAAYVLLIPFDNLLGAGSFGTLTKILGFLASICLIAWCFRTRRFALPPRSTIALVALLLWIGVSSFWAMDQSQSLTILPTYFGLTVLYLALACTPLDLRQYRTLLYFAIASGVISALYGANAFFHDPALMQQQNPDMRRLIVSINGIYIDPNHFSDAMLFPAAAIVMLGLRSSRVLGKVAALAGVCTIALAIALSGSREGLIGLAVIMAYYAWRSRYRMQVFALTAATVGATFLTQSSIWLRFQSAFATGGSGRTAIWTVGWEAFKHNWLIGYGIGNFADAYDTYYLQVYQAYTNGFTSPAHNIVMHYLVETGIIGFLLLSWFLWEHFTTLRSIDRAHPLFDDRIMLEASMLALIVVALSIDLFHYKYAWLLFAAIAQLRSVALTMRRTASARPHLPVT